MEFRLTSPKTIQTRESLGLVKDVYDPVATVREPLSAYRTMLDFIHSDPTLSTAFGIVVDYVTVRGFDFIKGTKESRDKLRDKFFELDFQSVSRNLMYSLLYYGDAFLELRKNNSSVNTPDELWVLETTEMRIKYDSHGKVTGYVQRPFNLSGLSEKDITKKEGEAGVHFKPDQVIHFRMKWIGSQVYSYNPNEPISQVAATRLYAGNYLMNIFINMPPRYVAHLAGISPKDHEKAKLEFQAAKTNYKKTIAFSRSSDPASKLQLQKIDPPYDKELIEIIKWINMEMLKVTRVPRTWVEKEGTENRGVGENINQPFEVYIMSLHRSIIEPPINRKLIPLLLEIKEESADRKKGEARTLLRYNEVTRKGEKEILMNAGLLRNIGLKHDALVRYLDEMGILGFDPTDFEEQQIAKDMALNESRQGMNKSTDSMKSGLDSTGTSDTSAKKMGIKA